MVEFFWRKQEIRFKDISSEVRLLREIIRAVAATTFFWDKNVVAFQTQFFNIASIF